MRTQIIAVLFVLAGCTLYGQEGIDFRKLDSATYALYKNASWDSLVKMGRKGIKNDLDYYYLRMRMGIANFELGKYTFSAPHFEKALQFNSQDRTAGYYLYKSFLYSGKKSRANRFARSFSKDQQEKLGIRNKALSTVGILGGYLFTNNTAKNGSIDLLSGSDEFAEQLLIGDQAFLHGGLGFNISHSVSLYAGFSFVTTQKQNRYQYVTDRFFVSSITPIPGGGYQNNYAVRRELKEQSYDGNIRQSELYLNGRIQFDKGFSFNLFTNILFIHLDKVDRVLVSTISRDTLSYIPIEDRYVMIDHQEFDYHFVEGDTSFVNWLAGFNLQKDFDFLVAALSTSFSRLYSDNIFQLDLSVTYFPLGSLVFYGQSGGIFLNEFSRGQEQRTAFSYYQLLGIRLQKKLWLEGTFYSGDLRNMNINQGSIVYNLPEKVNYTAGLKLLIFVNDHLSIDIKYEFANKSGSYFTESEGSENKQQFFTNYQTQSIIGGIKWTL